MEKIRKVSSRELTWIDIHQPTRKDLAFLKSKFKVSDQDINDSLPAQHAQRPIIIARSNYLFIIALFPLFDEENRTISAAEVDVFVTNDHLITIHDNRIKLIYEFFAELEKNKSAALNHLSDHPAALFYEILDKMYHMVYPMLDHLSKDIKNIESQIFAGKEKEMIREILVVKNNILNFKRIMQAHRSMIKKLLETEANYFGTKHFVDQYYTELLEHVKDIWTILETYGESIESLENTNSAIVTYKMNKVFTTLTMVSVIIFPLTLITGIFSMRSENTPIVGTAYDFWIILGLMAVATFCTFVWFKKKRLL